MQEQNHINAEMLASVNRNGWDDEETFHAFLADGDDGMDGETDAEDIADQVHLALKLLAEAVPTDNGQKAPKAEFIAPPLNSDLRSAQETIRPAVLGQIESPDLQEAFLQDAGRCLAALEQSVISYESGADAETELAKMARELHTLKGASATVGLNDIARYIHDVESSIQGPTADRQAVSSVVFCCVDTLRRQANKVAGLPSDETRLVQGPEVVSSPPNAAASNASIDTHSTTTLRSELEKRQGHQVETEDSISVKASQLDRLLDMLTALVMLRNQRESRIESLRQVNSEVTRCGSRLRIIERQLLAGKSLTRDTIQNHSNPLAEVANDLSEITRKLGESYGPMSEENLAVSNFIRQFRHAILGLLRTPISGIFLRLQRAAMDAARIEKKRVRLQVIGSDVGLERSVQERLFDPLLHIVRNAVSHGIETTDKRVQIGKDPVGTITLEAKGTPNLLILSICDDGNGLDYDALRRRGIEMGLLSGDRPVNSQELAQLIFRRGFSTRDSANEVAGRGIGMDVVVDALDRMHSWVEVESEPGQGTTVRISVPLRSIIDHVMIVRAGKQRFAIPMQCVRATPGTPLGRSAKPLSALLLNADQDQLINEDASWIAVEAHPSPDESEPTESTTPVMRGRAGAVLQVDEIVGAEEVVVRPLPPIFRHQHLYSGVTVSGNGQIVLLLNPATLTILANAHQSGSIAEQSSPTKTESRPRMLVVDDSLSARRVARSQMTKLGWDVIEAGDARTALDWLQRESFAAVITDFDMPRMNGLQLVEAIRKRTSICHLPIVMLSSRTVEDLSQRALGAGVTAYFRKPLTEADTEEVSNLLRNHQRS